MAGPRVKLSPRLPADRPIVFSGIQPSGEIHVGNYLGAIRNWARMLDDHFCIFCIVDYHAVTIDYEPGRMQQRILEAATANIAAGLDPERCKLFVQSHVPEHTELAWVFSTVCPMGDLSRMTQFKEKSRQHQQNINAGLFTYPVLQAADILLYKASGVPVGEDQVQHIELCREIARRFNVRFGDVFPEAEALLTRTRRVMGLDGQTKMGKSLGNHLGLLEDDETVRRKLKPAFTDPARKTRKDPGNPFICNIYTMHHGFSPPEVVEMVEVECARAGIGCYDCKMKLADSMDAVLAPVREKARQLSSRPDDVRQVLTDSAGFCRSVARDTMQEVREVMGLR
jgi:tryptophanyl-tRNA synthetase